MGSDILTGSKGLLFLKKKKQKDFSPFAPSRMGTTAPMNKSFLVLFFKKERPFFRSAR